MLLLGEVHRGFDHEFDDQISVEEDGTVGRGAGRFGEKERRSSEEVW